MSDASLAETFPALAAIPGLRHGFLLRIPGLDVDCERDEALARLAPVHRALLAELGVETARLATGEQVHGREVAAVDGEGPRRVHFPAADALVTAMPGQFLGVWVADCGAVFLVDPKRRACGIVHSGKKGTELGAVPAAIGEMVSRYGSDPADLVVQIAPCIRPPAYETDFAAQIVADCLAAGVPAAQVHDCGVCTSSDLGRYYSYRVEKGRTGRMFAWIGWDRDWGDELHVSGDHFEIEAPAKTNLWLRLLGKRADGYHEIDTRMVRLALADRLRLRWREDGRIVLRCSDATLPTGEENLVVKAVRALERHCGCSFPVEIELEKRIPHGAGLGGGSSDAASVLLALDAMAELRLPGDELAAVGATVGSDVPFFVYGRACDCRGRGEIVVPVPEGEVPPSLPVFLYKPAFGISAAWAYRRHAASVEYEGFDYAPQPGPWGELVNDLERPVFEKFPVLGEMKSWLRARPEVRAALLSGSGSTMLAVLEEGANTEDLARAVRERYGDGGWTWSGRTF
jgi:4-diphosphocytidyl-2-C-methyl-D-erythritol kinase